MSFRLIRLRRYDFEMSSRCLETPTVTYLAAFRFHDYIADLEAHGKFQHPLFGLDSIVKSPAP